MEIQQGTGVWPIVKGQSLTMTITPDEGRSLLRLLKDGQDVTAQVSNGKYTVQNMQQDFTLEAVFQEGTTPDPQPGGGGTARLSIEPFSIKAGETATMLIDLTNPDDEITALDFYMQLPEGLTIAMEDGEPALDIAGRTTWKKHTLTANTTDGHIMLYSATNATVSGTSGALISVKLQAGSTFAGGDIVLKNQTLNTPDLVVSRPADYTYTLAGGQPNPVLEMTMEVLNAINGVVYENRAYIKMTSKYKGEGSLPGLIFVQLYKLLDNGETEKLSGMKMSTWITGSQGYDNLRGDGKYKAECGYESATGKQVVFASATFECKIDNRYATVLMLDPMQTYCHESDLDFSSVQGLKAYTAGGFNTSTNEALMMRVVDVPATTGLLLVGQPGAYLVKKGNSSTVYVNMLKGVLEDTHIEQTEGSFTNYVFRDGEEGLGFYLAKNSPSISANEAYLQLPTSVAASRPIVTLLFDDTTGIRETDSDDQPFDIYTVGGLLVKRGATTLKGLPAGIYVVNGRKVVVR